MKGHTNSDGVWTRPSLSMTQCWWQNHLVLISRTWMDNIDKGILFSVVFLSLALGSPVKFKSNLIQFNLNDPG